MVSTTPRVITRSDPHRLEIEWSDGHRTVYSTAELRRICGGPAVSHATVAQLQARIDVLRKRVHS